MSDAVVDVVVSFQFGSKKAFVRARVNGAFVDILPDTKQAFVGYDSPPFSAPIQLTPAVWETLDPTIIEALEFRANATGDCCGQCSCVRM
jgi:hypothetical protein